MKEATEKDIKLDHFFLFNTTDSDYEKWSGKVVQIKRQLTLEECDEECQPMYKAITLDGKFEMDVFLDELFVI